MLDMEPDNSEVTVECKGGESSSQLDNDSQNMNDSDIESSAPTAAVDVEVEDVDEDDEADTETDEEDEDESKESQSTCSSNNANGDSDSQPLKSAIKEGKKGVMRIKLSLARPMGGVGAIGSTSSMRGSLPISASRISNIMPVGSSSMRGALPMSSSKSPVGSSSIKQGENVGAAMGKLKSQPRGSTAATSVGLFTKPGPKPDNGTPPIGPIAGITNLDQVCSVKIPAIVSPGLLGKGREKPSTLFDRAMKAAGYSQERRQKHPHRGSSVRRQVDDMFDTPVDATSLIPEHLENATIKVKACEEKELPLLPFVVSELNKLVGSFPGNKRLGDKPASSGIGEDNESQENKKKKQCMRMTFDDMIPKSLSFNYPSDFLGQKKKFAEDVKLRERAIVESQLAIDIADDAQEEYEEKLEEWNNQMLAVHKSKDPPLRPVKPMPPPTLKPIPPLPTSPKILTGHGIEPENKYLVEHLDLDCFNPAQRYHGLLSNSIADPQFVGVCAPGLAGIPGNGHSSISLNLAPVSGSGNIRESKDMVGKSSQISRNSGKSSSKKKSATALKSQELREIFEADGSDVPKIRDSLIKAAIACFTEGSGDGRTPWIASNGETYPDIGKSFSAFAGIKPCIRCRNNKQGAYHCRLRRKHKDPDWDGGNSTTKLGVYMKIYRLQEAIPVATAVETNLHAADKNGDRPTTIARAVAATQSSEK